MNRYFSLLLLLLLGTLSNASAQTLKLASFNIRYENEGDEKQGDGWKQRQLPLSQLIQFHDFDIFGAQEVLNGQLEDLLKLLPAYSATGVGRDDGMKKGEYAPIFYKKERFSALQTGTFWLSEDTSKPNKGWDAVLPRICTWGLFQDKKSKKKFMFFNTHFDHVGVKARQESAKLIMAKIKEIGKDQIPAVLSGDFNVDQNSDSYAVINNSGLLKDAFELADLKYAATGTFNSFKANSVTNSRIDHIFLTKNFKVSRYAVLTDTYRVLDHTGVAFNPANAPGEIKLQNSLARTPSDHYPVMIVTEL